MADVCTDILRRLTRPADAAAIYRRALALVTNCIGHQRHREAFPPEAPLTALRLVTVLAV
jgi:hypothetical protein